MFEPTKTGLIIHLQNGYRVSIQWGEGTYTLWAGFTNGCCAPEVAVINPNGQFITPRTPNPQNPVEGDEDVCPRVSGTEFVDILNWAVARSKLIKKGE